MVWAEVAWSIVVIDALDSFTESEVPIVFSDEVPANPREREWWYNSLDAAVTLEIYDKISRSNRGTITYGFERAMQGPALDMMQRGFRIDPIWRSRQTSMLEEKESKVEELLNRLAHPVWGRPLNPRSPDQLKAFFYGELHLPTQYANVKGEKRVSTNRESLEKLDDYYIASPFVDLIFAARGARKQLGVLRTGVGVDGRMRCSYGVAGTETGRFNSSTSVWGDGTNLQNITEELRRPFVADPGYILLYVDGEQAESRAVGFIQGRLFDDWRYLEACEVGDLHTYVARLVWPAMAWSGDLKKDRALAEQIFYRWFTYRDMAKRGGHGTSYYGQPWTMAKHLKVPVGLIQSFQSKFCKGWDGNGTGSAFPAFPKWWNWVGAQLGETQSITTFVGRERTFFGRPNDDATLREAIAYEPQSAVADLTNEGGLRVWRAFPEAQFLAQTHDSWTMQIPEDRLDLVDPIRRTFEVEVYHKSHPLMIPSECKLGWNWSNEDPTKKLFKDGNPDGLRKWRGSETRRRTEDTEGSLLDRVLY